MLRFGLCRLSRHCYSHCNRWRRVSILSDSTAFQLGGWILPSPNLLSDRNMASATSTPSPPPSSPALSLLSLAIFIHLTCVFVVLGSNLQRSPLQARLVSLFAVYTKFFNFDPDFTPYYLVSGRDLNDLLIDDDAVLVLDLYGDAFEPLANQKRIRTV